MTWKITYYNRVESGLAKWPTKILAKYMFIISLMRKHGPNLGEPYTKAFGDGLFEIRAKGQEGIGRAFFCTSIGQEIVVLHQFIKKTQKTPKKELEIAYKRLKEVKK
jgi:phage-related protein